MSNRVPTILALDFDGVICDGLIEYFQTTQQTYYQIWNDDSKNSKFKIQNSKFRKQFPSFKDDKLQSDELATNFYRLRPVIETGWEMPILLRALILGISEEEILQYWSTIAEQIIKSETLDKKEVSQKLDRVRDRWIESDLESWLALHRFYPGVIERICGILDSSIQVYIVTTKEGRFVRRLLQQQGIELPETSIIGKEYKRPKYETLRQLLQFNSVEPTDLWFVEDRLEALELVQEQPDLQGIKLYLADWGYNTQKTRDSLSDRQDIKLLSLVQFNQDFSVWE
jgi:phosphoglycolate phosphatase-like HAD superfamily hydrolase